MKIESELSNESWNLLLNGAKHQGRIYQGDARLYSVHGLYGYPARFSPYFVQSALKALSQNRSNVLDPFMGSGTTLLESLKMGRSPAGIDLSPISNFIVERLTRGTSTKTLNKAEESAMEILSKVEFANRGLVTSPGLWPKEHQGDVDFLELYSLLENFVSDANELRGETAKLLQLVALSAGQWAIDGRRCPVSRTELLERMRLLSSTVPRLVSFWNQSLNETWGTKDWRSQIEIFHGDASEQLKLMRAESNKQFDLAITSPPYVGVHVLYAKWQLRGRKETHLPAYIVGAKPRPESFLTMGARKTGESEYFDRMSRVAEGMAMVMRPKSLFVQLVGFNNSATQLPRYLDVFEEHGFARLLPPNVEASSLSRMVPSRKWHANHLGELDTKKEHLLVFSKVD